MKKKVVKIGTIVITFLFVISLVGQSIAHAEEEHIYYSDLFYGYDSSYLTDLTRSKLDLYNDDASYRMITAFNEYIDSPYFTWTGIKTSISAATSLETFLKLLTDAYGDEHGATYYDGMDAANADFVKELMGLTALSEANAHYGKCGKVAKKSKDLLKIYTEFDKAYDVYQMKDEKIITEYMAILTESDVYESLSVTEIRVYEEVLLPNLDKLGESVDFGCKAFEAAGALSMALLIEDVRMEIIDDIMENVPENSELYNGMSRLKSQLKNGWKSYIFENYVSDKVMGEICSSMQKAIVSASGAENYGLVTSIIKVASWVVFDCIMDVPDLEDVYKQIVLRGYYTTLYNALNEKVEIFDTSEQIFVDDVRQFENLFEAYIAMSRVALEATAGLEIPSNEGKSQLILDKYKNFTYDNHIAEIISLIKEFDVEDRKYKFVENYEIKLPMKICQPSDDIEEGCVYMINNALQGNATFTGSGAIETNEENSGKVVGIKGNAIINGKVDIGDSRLEVEGSLYINSYGKIAMQDSKGYLLVNKNTIFAIANANYTSQLYKGTIELKGDVLWKENTYATVWELFNVGWLTSEGADCNINMIFNGQGVQNITIPVAEPEGYNGRNMLGNVTINSAGLNIPEGATIYKLGSDLYIDGDTKLLNIHDWNGKNVEVRGSVNVSDTNALFSPGENSVLKINGNLNLNKGKLIVGKGRVEIEGSLYINSYGKIAMQDSKGYLLVNKNTIFAIANANYTSQLYKGTIELKGDVLWKENTYATVWELFNVGWLTSEGADCNINMIFNGQGVQNITIPVAEPEGYNGRNMLGNVTINSAGLNIPEGATIYKLGSDLYIDGDTKLLNIHDWNGKNVEVRGSVNVSDTNALFSPGENSVLKINGNLNLNKGKLIVGKGRVEVEGSLYVNNYGKIIMNNEKGYLLIENDLSFSRCEWYTESLGKSELYYGTIEVKGDISDLPKDKGAYGWVATSEMQFVLSGDSVHDIEISYSTSEYSYLPKLIQVGGLISIKERLYIAEICSDLKFAADSEWYKADKWNGYKIELIGVPRDKVSSKLTLYYDGYGKVVSKNLTNTEKYDITYQPAEATYTVKYYVGSSLKKTQAQYCAKSLVEPYSVTLVDCQEFDGWYLDSDLTQKFDIEKDIITSDISLYGRIVNHVTSVTLNKSEIVFDEVGSTDNLIATVLPLSATDKTVKWTVLDNSIVKISDNGSVEALSTGTTMIKAKAGKCEAECKIVVKQKDIADVSVEPIADVEYIGKTQEIVPKLASNIRTLILQEDYEVIYSDDAINVGTVTVTVNGIGNYCGTRQVTYDIVPAVPVVNPILSKEEIFECDSLPMITTSYGDTEGNISFDAEQNLIIGTSNYNWTFTPDNLNYKVIKGMVPITVKAVEVESIYVKTQPDKLDYAVGEIFDVNGMVVIAKYNNGTEVEVSDYSVDLANEKLVLGNTEVVVSYVADGTVFTASIAIEVFEQLSVNTDLSSVQVRGIYGTVSGNSIDVVLPIDADADVREADIAIHTACPYASVESLQKDAESGFWLFRIVAQHREVFADYILTVRKAESEEEYMRSRYRAAESAIGRLNFAELMQSVSKPESGKTASLDDVINGILDSINGLPEMEATGITMTAADITIEKYEPAIDGDAEEPDGTQGSYSFKVSYSDENFSINSGTVEGVLESVPFTGMTNAKAVILADALITTNYYSFEAMNNVSTQEEWVSKIVEQINKILAAQELNIVITTDDVWVVAYVAPRKGTLDNPNGRAGSIIFSVALNKGKALYDTEQITVGLPATSIKVYTVSASASVGGTISPQGVSRVEMGDNLTYAITPSAGYEIKSLLVDGFPVKATGSYSFKNMQGNHTIVASFGKELPEVGDLNIDIKNNAVWRITSADTVEFVSLINKKKTKVIIPSLVKIDGVTFEVTAIEKNAFKNNKKVKTVTISKNVMSIGDNAFYKCIALTKITIPSKVKIIGKNAFYGCSKLKILKIKTTKLTTKKIGSKAFSKTPKSMEVIVPQKKFKKYKAMLIKKGVNKKAKLKKE